MTEADVYQLTLRILCVGIFIGSCESIYLSWSFGPGQPFDWLIVKPDYVKEGSLAFSCLNPVYSRPGTIVIMILRLVAIIPIVFAPPTGLLYSSSLLLLVVLTLLVYYRHSYGMDGADQMTFIILLTVSICWLFDPPLSVKLTGIVFLGAQLSLSYLASGAAKLISATWRSGAAADGVLSTYTYGNEVTRAATKHHSVAFFLCWFTILFELTFSLALFFPHSSLLAWLVAGALFHLGIAIVMGLNDFFWAFLAAYPAFYYLAVYILPRYTFHG